jgi:hypothetical protein
MHKLTLVFAGDRTGKQATKRYVGSTAGKCNH